MYFFYKTFILYIKNKYCNLEIKLNLDSNVRMFERSKLKMFLVKVMYFVISHDFSPLRLENYINSLS